AQDAPGQGLGDLWRADHRTADVHDSGAKHQRGLRSGGREYLPRPLLADDLWPDHRWPGRRHRGGRFAAGHEHRRWRRHADLPGPAFRCHPRQ
nr:hypothetical protein [Tanacetum cinerariifolium]